MDTRDRKFGTDEEKIDLADPLGLDGECIEPDGIVRASSEESIRARRRRSGLSPDNDDRNSTGMDEILKGDHKGATGIDMGAGGDDTQITFDKK